MESKKLTDKWQLIKIGNEDYFLLIMGQSPPSSSYILDGDGLPFFQVKADFGQLHPVAKVYCNSPQRIAKEDDILISVRAPVGPTNLADQECCIGRGLAAIRCKGKALSKYVLYALRHLESDIAAKVRDQGGGFTAIRREQLADVEIPIPPLPEQRRIVTRIEELTSRVEQARTFLEEAQKEISDSFQSGLDGVFSESDDHGWVTKSVKEICKPPQYGFTASAVNEKVGPQLLRITDIQNGEVDWHTVPYCVCDDLEKYKLESGDIVFARTGATTGKTYLIQDPPKAVFASYLIRLRPSNEILSDFLYWYFQSSNYWASVFSGIDEGNRPNMNGSKLADLKVPYPKNKKEQRRIVKYLVELREKSERIRRLQNETELELGSLVPALLAKAFRGELVSEIFKAKEEKEGKEKTTPWGDDGAVATALLQELVKRNRPTSEFSIQKHMFFLKERIHLSINSQFERKAAGPWSRELRQRAIYAAEKKNWIKWEGNRLTLGRSAEKGMAKAKELLGDSIQDIAALVAEVETFGNPGLERWSTILYIVRELEKAGTPVTRAAIQAGVDFWPDKRAKAAFAEVSVDKAIFGMEKLGWIKLAK